MKRLVPLLLLVLSACVIYPERRVRRYPGREPVSATKIVAMQTAGLPDDQMIEKIGQNGINHEQSADDIIIMKKAGVSETVIKAMIDAPVLPPAPAYEEEVYTRHSGYYYDSGSSFWLGAALGYWLRPGHHHHR